MLQIAHIARAAARLSLEMRQLQISTHSNLATIELFGKIVV
jgi:hypothetical protein